MTLCAGLIVLIDALLPTKKHSYIFDYMEYRNGKDFRYHELFFKNNFTCSAYTDPLSLSNLTPNEAVTVRKTRITSRCTGIEKNGAEIYRDTYWRLLYLACAILGIGFGIGKIDPENWWGR